METQKNIDLAAYTGRWYEYAKDHSIPYELFGDCITATYGAYSEGSDVDITVDNREFFWPIFSYIELNACARCNPEDGRCGVTRCGSEYLESAVMNYDILETDYENYSVVYSCTPRLWGLATDEAVWVLTREPSLNDDLFERAESKIKEILPNYGWWWFKTKGRQGDSCSYS